MAVRRGARRAENFAVRRWLQVGAASAGVGAGLLGFSLLGPQVGTAAADTAGETTTSTSASASDDGASTGSTASTASTDAADDTDRADDADDADDADADDDAREDDADEADELDDQLDDDDLGDDESDEDIDDDEERTADTEEQADDTSAASKTTEDAEPEAKSQALTRPTAPKPPPGNWSDVTGRAIDNWTKDSQGWINSLPVDNQAKYHLEGALWATKRTFLNQAPTVAPIQISGKLDGPVTGTLRAVDPDGDRLIYVVTRGPKSGSVKVNADGTYTYTPGTDFDGVDTFRVVAVDVGPHVNLLDPFRPIGTSAGNLVNQRAITFEFTFVEGAEYWTPERVAALHRSADETIEYFVVTAPVVLTYDVEGMDDEDSSTLASAYSGRISQDPGFWPTVVQHKLLTGIDANGDDADGEIEWNFGTAWGLGDTVAPDEYDFVSTAMHELMHSFGFIENFSAPGQSTGTTWFAYAGFVVTRDRDRPIGPDLRWDPDFDPYLDGHDGGLYFDGAHAVAAYGGLVPLYMPNPWNSGSSTSHLDDTTFTGDDQKLMNARTGSGPGVRVLSPIEIGILRDLGYRVSAPVVQV
jgi:hypothetical protein